MRDDTPDDLVHDVFAGALFPERPLGREISGSQETITAVTRDQIAEYHAALPPVNVVVAVAGNVDHDHVVDAWRPGPTTAHRARGDNGADGYFPRHFARSTVRWSSRTWCSAPERCVATTPTGSRSRRRPGARRRHELPALPGGAREARPGLFRLLVPQRVPGDRCVAVYCATAPERVDEDPRRRARRARSARRRRRRVRPRAQGRRATSPARWRCRSRARRAACTAWAGPSSRWVSPEPRLGGRAGRRGHRPTTSPGSSTGCWATARTLALVGPADTLPDVTQPDSGRPMIRVGVFGAAGRMGATVCQAVPDDPELELVAAVDPITPVSTSPVRRRRRQHPRRAERGCARRRRRRGRGRLHRGRRCARQHRVVRRQRRARGRRHHRVLGRRHRTAPPLRPSSSQRGDRAELRHRRGADGALRRARRAVLRDRRGDRAPPRPEDRRAVGHRDAHRRAHGRSVGRLGAPTPPPRR